MALNTVNNASLGFKGTIKVNDKLKHQTEQILDHVALSQLTNNLRRVGIDRRPGAITQDGGLIVQPGLVVRHNKDGDTVTFTVHGKHPETIDYVIKRDQQPETTNVGEHKKIFDDAIKFIDRTIEKSKEKSNVLADVDLTNGQAIFSAIHKLIY